MEKDTLKALAALKNFWGNQGASLDALWPGPVQLDSDTLHPEISLPAALFVAATYCSVFRDYRYKALQYLSQFPQKNKTFAGIEPSPYIAYFIIPNANFGRNLGSLAA